jgi:hypothetical protein
MNSNETRSRLTSHTLFVTKANYFVSEYPQSTVLMELIPAP